MDDTPGAARQGRTDETTLRWSLPISVLMHLAILISAMVMLPGPEAFRVPPQEALPVEIVDITEVSRRVTMRKDAPEKPAKKPAPPKVERKPEPKPQPRPQPKPAPKPSKPAPKPTPPPKPAPKPAPKAEPAPPPDADALKQLVEKVAEPEPKPAPEKPAPQPAETRQAPPAPKPRVRPRQIRKLAALHQKQRQQKAQRTQKDARKTVDPIDEIAALLNKVDEKPQATEAESDRTGTPLRGPANINGNDAQLAADIIDALRQRVESCWNVPVGVRDAEGLRVRVRFQLSPDGTVSGGPVVLNRMNHPAFDAAAGSAVRAVLACQPYDFLPPDRYDLWKDVILNFDPARMLRIN